MTYLLDTNAWARHLNQPDSGVSARLESHRPDAICLCSVVKAELLYGAHKSARRERNPGLLAALFSRFHSFSFDDRAAEFYGALRADLAAQGRPIGPNDLLIASIALANRLTLVTRNTGEFSRVPGLIIEDWEGSAA